MDASLKIFGIPTSRALRCLWMARELGIPFENDPVHFQKTHESDALKAINPNVRIPAIDDNGFHLYESMAINLYLAKKYGAGSPLVPTSLEDEARTTQWSFWVMTEIEKLALAMMFDALKMRPLSEEARAATQAELERPLGALEQHLQDRDYLLGDHFTVADLNVASVMAWARWGKVDMSKFPKAADWLKRCMGRPAFKG